MNVSKTKMTETLNPYLDKVNEVFKWRVQMGFFTKMDDLPEKGKYNVILKVHTIYFATFLIY